LIWKAVFLSVLGFVAATLSAVAQAPPPHHMSGLINDYVPITVTGGPWEMHGQWTLDLNERERTADFAADMTMSGFGKIEVNGVQVVDPSQPGLGPHTHHIKLTRASVKWNSDGCPQLTPSTVGGFQMTGPVSIITGNGTNAPFEPTPPTTQLQVCVTGGSGPGSVQYSNITLLFVTGSPAIKHFGPQAIRGVVRKTDYAEPRW
jgi:hypothetical protein